MNKTERNKALNRWKKELAEIVAGEQSHWDMVKASRLRRDIKRLEKGE